MSTRHWVVIRVPITLLLDPKLGTGQTEIWTSSDDDGVDGDEQGPLPVPFQDSVTPETGRPV